MEQLKADIMIGPLSGDESIAVANYAKQHPKKTFVDGAAGAQDTTLKVRAPNFFRFNGDGAQWNAGLGDLAYQQARLAQRCRRGGRLFVRVDVCRGLHRRVLRGRRQRDQAGLPAAEHDRLLVVCPAAPDERRRHVRRGRRGWSDPVPEGLRAGARPDQLEEVHRQPVLGHAGPVRAALDPRLGRVLRRCRNSRRPRNECRQGYNAQVGKTFDTIPPFGAAAPQASSTFTYGYYVNTWGLSRRPEEGEAATSPTGRRACSRPSAR